MAKVKSHVFRGKRYKILHVPPSILRDKNKRKFKADCDHPETKGKKIRISKKLKGLILLDTYIHEACHASAFNLSENLVNEMARDIAKFLTRIGYILPDKKKSLKN